MVPPRSAGVLVPAFSLRSARSWGVGELPDLAALAPWMLRAGLRYLVTLPLLEVALGQASPYSALSAFALDPVYLGLGAVEDFAALGGEAAMPAEDRAILDRLREEPGVDWGAARRLKDRWLRRCFERFQASGAASRSQRAASLARFEERHRAWLPDYSLFRALKDEDPSRWWRGGWPQGLRDREPGALAAARARLAPRLAYFTWLQWQAYEQLAAARAEARRLGVLLGGDLPFMVAEDSADAWSRQHQLRFDATIGAPPDDYSEEGQDWGLPAYRWDALAARGYDWLRQRGVATAEAFDLVRVDHVVGFYRTYVRPRDGTAPVFVPADEPAQIRQGEAVLEALSAGGSFVIAEDLGTVPDFVRASLTRLGVPGFRVLRWEKDDGAWRDPEAWPDLSVATTGTHDTETLAVWWEALTGPERAALCKLPSLFGLEDERAFSRAVHLGLLETVLRSGSRLALLPLQDLFGLRERVNVPGTTGAGNWTWRMPWAVGALTEDPYLRSQTAAVRRLAADAERL